tara:strand:+ start:147 stop:1028 length:882 start_codon:yes stop_codon:yes gene_type:complete
MKRFKTVAIYSTNSGKRIKDIINHCSEVLTNLKLEVLLTENCGVSISNSYKVYKDEVIVKKADLIISIGGDGTLLACARKFGLKGLPLLGINLGNVGFLADLAPEDITFRLKEIVKGKYISDQRFMLEVSLNDFKDSNFALNEVVIHSGTVAQLIEYEVFIDQEFVYRQRADGLIISTPTGSTAYSLSGGGPIIHPNINAITLLPMFPHSLNSNPLLIDYDSEIQLKILDSKNKSQLSLDSQNILTVSKKDEVKMRRAQSSLILIHPEDHDFYSSCRTKLGWSIGISNKSDDL